MAFVGHNAVIEEQWGNPALLVPPLLIAETPQSNMISAPISDQ